MPKTAADLTVKVGADTSDFESGMGRVDGTINKTRQGMGTASLALGAGAGLIAGGFMYAGNAAMNFEGAMADVNASLMPTTQELEQLQGVALKIGQETTFNATEGARAIEELGLAGIAIPDIMNGGAMAVAQLASATGEDLPASATTMANAMTIFKISGDQAGATADTMTAALNESSLTLTDFSQGMASAGVMANAVGMSFEQTSAALALFSANGMSGADAGTALRSMLTHMANPTAEAAALFDQLGFSMQEGIESGDLMAYTAGKLQTGLAHLSEEERLAALNTLFGADAQRVANILFEEGAEGVNEMTQKMIANGQAQEAARRRMGGLRGAIESMTGSIETAAIVIGSGLTPFLTIMAEKVGDAVNWFSSLPEPLIRLVSIVAGVVGALMGLGAAIGGVMAAGALIPGGFAAVGAAMMAILGPVALVVAAAVGLYVAFQTNFMGLRDIVTSAMDAITGVFGSFGEIIRATADGDVPRIKAAFESLPEPLRPLGGFINQVTASLVGLYNVFAQGGLSALMDQLPAELDRIGNAFADLGRAILDGIGNIDWGSLFSRLGDAAGAIWAWITEQVGRVDWQGAFESAMGMLASAGSWVAGKLGEAITAIGTWIVAQVQGVDWSGAFSTGLAALVDAGTWVADKLGSAVDALGTWIGEQVAGVDWASLIGTIGTTLSNVITLAITGMADVFVTLLNWVTRQIEGVNWSSVGSKFAELLVLGIKGIVGLAGVSLWLLGQVLLAIVEVPWGDVASAFGTFLKTAITGLVGFLSGFADTLFNELKTELGNVNWSSLGNIIKEAFKGAVVGVGSAIGQAIWNELPGWLKGLIEGGAGALGIGQGPTTNAAGGAFGSYEPNPNGPMTNAYGQQDGWYTPYSDPYNPTEGGQGVFENNQGLWLAQAQEARDYSAALDAVALSQSSVSASAVPLSTDLTSVNTALTNVGPGFVTLSGELTKTQQSFVTFVTAVMSVMGGFAAGVPALVNAAMGPFQTRISTGTSAGKQSFITFVGDTIAVMGGWSGGIGTIVDGAMSRIQSRVSTGTSAAKSSFVTFVGDTIAVMGGWSGGVGNIVNSTMSNMQSRVSGAMSSIQGSIRGGMAGATSAIRGEAGQWASIIGNTAGDMRDAGSRAGRAAGEGLVAGMASMEGAVAAQAASLASAATAAINSALDAHSPSRVTTQSGIWAGEGLGLGLYRMRDMVIDNARALARAATEAMVIDASDAVRWAEQVNGASAVTGAVMRGATPIVYNDYRTYTVKVDDLPELSRAAEFISDLERDREQMYGGG